MLTVQKRVINIGWLTLPHWALLLAVLWTALCWTAPARAAYSDTVLSQNPVGYWRFEDRSTADSALCRDIAGPTNESGRYYGIVSSAPGVPGIGGQAAVFGGTDSHVFVDPYSTLALNSLSVTFWVRSLQAWSATPGQYGLESVLVSRATSGAGSGDWAITGGNGPTGNGHVRSYTGTAGVDTLLYSTRKLNDGLWHHIAWTRDASTRFNALYVDAVLSATTLDLGGSIVNSAGIYFGGDPIRGGGLLTGALDEIAIFSRPLSASEVQAQFASSIPEPSALVPLAAAAVALSRRARKHRL